MPSGKNEKKHTAQLEPLGEIPQLGMRAYQALVNNIVSGRVEPGASLRREAIARQLEINTGTAAISILVSRSFT
jgi:hypothetical protein